LARQPHLNARADSYLYGPAARPGKGIPPFRPVEIGIAVGGTAGRIQAQDLQLTLRTDLLITNYAESWTVVDPVMEAEVTADAGAERMNDVLTG
jgi:hypothetical protein